MADRDSKAREPVFKNRRTPGGGFRQDRFSNFDGDKHEHTWSRTENGQHKEGWVGQSSERKK